MSHYGHLYTSQRLSLRKITIDDAQFVLTLVNDPDWLTHIGDRNVHNLADAKRFIEQGPLVHYKTHGFGLYVFELRNTQTPLGLCGLLKRDFLDYPDIGYAILPEYRGHGFSFEAAKMVLNFVPSEFNISQVHALVSPQNALSIRLIVKLGFNQPPEHTQWNNQSSLLFSAHVDDLSL